VIVFTGAIALAVVIILIIVFRSLKVTRKQKAMIEEQKNIVEEKNKDITDSIHYASRIQKALLTTDDYISSHLKEYFILFKPRDIVSGDFYWANEVETNKGRRFIICAGDCTGHGVPGAFMSLLNISMLNEANIEKKIHEPAEILDEVREHIIKALNPEGKDEGSKDGMDCTLCSFSLTEGMLDFACANNPLWIIRNNECIEFKPDKMPVGVQGEKHVPFTKQSTPLQKGDMVYIFTDGYADQFGGPKGKKFKCKQLQEKLIVISTMPIAEQKNRLEKTFEEWKGNLEQVDDVLLIGIRV
jgi:serine phosphatase RsbU (regulator of sigma subunit)